MVYCRFCGAQLHETAPFCPKCGAPQGGLVAPRRLVRRTFGNSIGICFENYVGFQGRAPSAEYWYFQLFQVLCQLAAFIAFIAAGPIPSAIIDLVFFLPALAVSVRRLHDIDRSGWWLLLVFIPIVGWIVLFVWACTRGTPGPNRFGEDQLLADA